MDRETTTHKIGEYEFHFWSKYKGGEIRQLQSLLSKAKSFDESGMLSLVMDNIYEVGAILCHKVKKGDEDFKVNIADELDQPEYMEFFEVLTQTLDKIMGGMSKKKVKS